MSLPIKRDELPEEILASEFGELLRKSVGEHGEQLSKEKFYKSFRGTEITKRPYAHLSRDKQWGLLEKAKRDFGLESISKVRSLRMGFKEHQRQASTQLQKPTTGSPGHGFLSGVLRGIFSRQKTQPGGEFHRLSEERRLESLSSQPPSPSPTQNFRKPQLSSTELPASVVKR